jgi:hypothetical protein
MYAIINKTTGEWVFGTDYNYSPPKQRLSREQAVLFADEEQAFFSFKKRRCNEMYEVVEVDLVVLKVVNKNYF